MNSTTHNITCGLSSSNGWCIAESWLWSLVSPILLLTGLLGNTLTIAVFCQARQRKRKPILCITLIALASADILVHFTGLLRHWVRKATIYTSYDIQTLSNFFCKLHEFLVYFGIMFATWIVVLISMERFLAVCYRMKVHRLVTQRRIIISIVILAIVCIGINAHFFFTRFLEEEKPGKWKCKDKSQFKYFKDDVWPTIDMIFSTVVPFLILIICNGAIIAKVCITAPRSMVRYCTSADNGAVSTNDTNESCYSNTINSNVKINNKILLKNCTRKISYVSTTTRMLLPVLILFLLLMFPVKIYLMLFSKNKAPHHVERNTNEYHAWRFFWACLLVLQYSNNCVNFFIYSAMSSHFRRDVKHLFDVVRWHTGRSATNFQDDALAAVAAGHNSFARSPRASNINLNLLITPINAEQAAAMLRARRRTRQHDDCFLQVGQNQETSKWTHSSSLNNYLLSSNTDSTKSQINLHPQPHAMQESEQFKQFGGNLSNQCVVTEPFIHHSTLN